MGTTFFVNVVLLPIQAVIAALLAALIVELDIVVKFFHWFDDKQLHFLIFGGHLCLF